MNHTPPHRRRADLMLVREAAPPRSVSHVLFGSVSSRRRVVWPTLAGCIAVGAIGYLDYVVGRGVTVALLYLLPVIGAAYSLGKQPAMVVTAAAGAASFVADLFIGEAMLVLLWNTISRTLIFAIQAWLVATLQQEWRREADLARRDPVTGLANSRTFNEALTSSPVPLPAAVAYIDLDNFKAINDRYGHSVGDDVLARVARGLRQVVREKDVAARVGGDEFAVLLRDADRHAAEAFATRLQTLVERISAAYPGTGLGASVGIIVCRTADVSGDELIRIADAAMYEVKASRKGTWVVREFDPAADAGRWPERRTGTRAG